MKSTNPSKKAENLFNQISQDNEVLRIFKHHSLRVMYFSTHLAKLVGCYDEDLRLAALLHDIGKIGLAKEILLKPTKLDELEYQIVQAHSVIGNNIIRKILNLKRAAVFVRDHHERWDGNGYPRGLEADEISIQGRIIAISDAFDTMTIDNRNYHRRTLSYTEAITELNRCAWVQFDGDLVKKFETIIQHLALPSPQKLINDEDQIHTILMPQ